MIGVTIDFNKQAVQTMLEKFPYEAKQVLRETVKRIGFTIERNAKKDAPIITGNLRRQINFLESDSGGFVRSNADYSAFVHGPPLGPGMRRKQNPFLTDAGEEAQGFIDQEIEAIPDKIIARIK